MKNLSERKIKTIRTLVSMASDAVTRGHVSAGWTPESNIFGDSPISAEKAEKMNAQHDENIVATLKLVVRLIDGEEVPEYMGIEQ